MFSICKSEQQKPYQNLHSRTDLESCLREGGKENHSLRGDTPQRREHGGVSRGPDQHH